MNSATHVLSLAVIIVAGSLDVILGHAHPAAIFVYSCLQDDWDPLALEKSTVSDDVILSISHRAMQAWLDFVPDLQYTGRSIYIVSDLRNN